MAGTESPNSLPEYRMSAGGANVGAARQCATAWFADRVRWVCGFAGGGAVVAGGGAVVAGGGAVVVGGGVVVVGAGVGGGAAAGAAGASGGIAGIVGMSLPGLVAPDGRSSMG